MFSGEIAKYQIQDRIGQAESYRASRATRAAAAAARRTKVRRVASGTLAVLLSPVRH